MYTPTLVSSWLSLNHQNHPHILCFHAIMVMKLTLVHAVAPGTACAHHQMSMRVGTAVTHTVATAHKVHDGATRVTSDYKRGAEDHFIWDFREKKKRKLENAMV
jgi:hypothetical protein